MTLPNFLLIGPGRTGTTSLYHWLREHPDVSMSRNKEACYFAFDEMAFKPSIARTLAEYEANFDDVTTEKAIGEACPAYLLSRAAPDRIRALLPDVRLIATLRNPAERAYSHWLHNIRRVGEYREAEVALQPGSLPFEQSFYAGALQRYYDRFPAENIKVILFEDLAESPDQVMRDLFSFLGVDPDVSVATGQRYNESKSPRSILLNRVFNDVTRIAKRIVPRKLLSRSFRAKLQAPLLREREPLPADLRRRLIDAYRDDIVATEALIGRDLSKWLV